MGGNFLNTGLSGKKSTIIEKLKSLIYKKFKKIIIHSDDIKDIYKFKFYFKKRILDLKKANSDYCYLLSKMELMLFYNPGFI